MAPGDSLVLQSADLDVPDAGDAVLYLFNTLPMALAIRIGQETEAQLASSSANMFNPQWHNTTTPGLSSVLLTLEREAVASCVVIEVRLYSSMGHGTLCPSVGPWSGLAPPHDASHCRFSCLALRAPLWLRAA